MSGIITKHSEVPDAPFYVTCIDTFMSGWGKAKGRANRLIFPCDSRQEAEIVYDNALGRTDQQDIIVTQAKPYIEATGYLYQVLTKKDAAPWFVKNTWPPSPVTIRKAMQEKS